MATEMPTSSDSLAEPDHALGDGIPADPREAVSEEPASGGIVDSAELHGRDRPGSTSQCKRERLREAAIQALLTHGTTVKAATAIGVGERTLRRWFHDDYQFQVELRFVRRRALEAIEGRIATLADAAVCTLERGMQSPDLRIAVRAAAVVLDHTLKAAEAGDELADVEHRLGALEDLAGLDKPRQWEPAA